MVHRLIAGSVSPRMTNHPWKGRGQVTWTQAEAFEKFLGGPGIILSLPFTLPYFSFPSPSLSSPVLLRSRVCPIPFTLSPFLPLLPSSPSLRLLRNSPIFWLRGLRERLNSPCGSGRSLAAKRILVHFRHKFAPFWLLWRIISCVYCHNYFYKRMFQWYICNACYCMDFNCKADFWAIKRAIQK